MILWKLQLDTIHQKVDILFLGSSVYAGTYDKSVEVFLNKNKDKIGRIICFGTSATGKSTRDKIAKWGDKNNVSVDVDYFHCPGHFLIHKNRPNEEDIANIKEFAKKTIG